MLGNQALAMNDKFRYVFVKLLSTNDIYLLAEPLLENIRKIPPFLNEQIQIVGTCQGKSIELNLIIERIPFARFGFIESSIFSSNL